MFSCKQDITPPPLVILFFFTSFKTILNSKLLSLHGQAQGHLSNNPSWYISTLFFLKIIYLKCKFSSSIFQIMFYEKRKKKVQYSIMMFVMFNRVENSLHGQILICYEGILTKYSYHQSPMPMIQLMQVVQLKPTIYGPSFIELQY